MRAIAAALPVTIMNVPENIESRLGALHGFKKPTGTNVLRLELIVLIGRRFIQNSVRRAMGYQNV